MVELASQHCIIFSTMLQGHSRFWVQDIQQILESKIHPCYTRYESPRQIYLMPHSGDQDRSMLCQIVGCKTDLCYNILHDFGCVP